jgi:hypothetical protein
VYGVVTLLIRTKSTFISIVHVEFMEFVWELVSEIHGFLGIICFCLVTDDGEVKVNWNWISSKLFMGLTVVLKSN